MSVQDCMRDHGGCIAGVTVATVVTVGLISMLVCGILGRLGKLPMAPAGARVMTAIPLSIIFTILTSLAGACAAHCR